MEKTLLTQAQSRDDSLDMRHIQYQGETLPPSPLPTSPLLLVLAFHLVLGKFHI